ncbi:MAG: sel1 repeat family protein, partial [Hyphomicrobiales bacterium]
QAVSWWNRAVEAGDADAMAMLGAANHLGQGVERDPMRAMVLLIMAQAGGSPLAATFFNAVKSALPPGAFEKAEALAARIAAQRGDGS